MLDSERLQQIHSALKTAVPDLDGLSIEDKADLSTWTIWRGGGPAVRLVDDAVALAATQSPAMTAALAAPAANRFQFSDFLDLFTPAEQALLMASADAPVRLFLLRAAGTGNVDLNGAQANAGLTRLVNLGIITGARKAAILATLAAG